MLYRDFVREQFKTRPSGVSASSYMKKIGELWREQKSSLHPIQGKGTETKEEKTATKDIINKIRDYVYGNKETLRRKVFDGVESGFVNTVVAGVDLVIEKMGSNPQKIALRKKALRKYGIPIIRGIWNVLVIALAIYLKVKFGITILGRGKQQYPYTAVEELPYNDLVDKYYQENNDFRALYE